MGVLKDFNTQKIRREEASPDGLTRYNIIDPGVSYAGVCRTRGCDGFQKRVICNRGLGSHLVNDDIVNEVPKCPCCRATFAVEVVMLYQCSATVTVHDANEQRSSFVCQDSEVILIGERGQDAAMFSTQRLVTVDAKRIGSKCSVM